MSIEALCADMASSARIGAAYSEILLERPPDGSSIAVTFVTLPFETVTSTSTGPNRVSTTWPSTTFEPAEPPVPPVVPPLVPEPPDVDPEPVEPVPVEPVADGPERVEPLEPVPVAPVPPVVVEPPPPFVPVNAPASPERKPSHSNAARASDAAPRPR